MQLVRAFIKTFESVGIYSVIPLNLQLSSQNTDSKSRLRRLKVQPAAT